MTLGLQKAISLLLLYLSDQFLYMKHLHAYWRMEYVEAPKCTDTHTNPFAGLKDCTNDKSSYLIYRGKECCIVMNKYPYNSGHLLVLPYRVVSELENLSEGEQKELMDLIILGKSILKKALNPDGFNIGFNFGDAAGAGIPEHLHAHIVPRWTSDTNFMPVLSDTRVLPSAMDAMWERLRSQTPSITSD